MAASLSSWEQLTDVERTALGVAFGRLHGSELLRRPDNDEPYYVDPYAARVVAEYIPPEVQQQLRSRWASWVATGDAATAEAAKATSLSAWMAARTASLDERIADVVAAQPSLKQVVIIGAGMDTRAWRMTCWHPGTSLFEVDTPTMLSFKQRLMDKETPSCARRAAVPADASQPLQVEQALLAAGFQLHTSSSNSDSQVPTLWLLEGFIGYITKEEAATLLQWMVQAGSPGSVLLMTAPPNQQTREQHEQQPPAEAGPGGAAAEGSGSTNDVLHKLHHKTFEEVEETAARVAAAGWQQVQVDSGESLAKKYGVGRAQSIITAVTC